MTVDALPDATELSLLLDDACRRHRVPGAAVGILADGTAVTAVHGVGNTRTGEPMTIESVSQIASVSKVFTATALMGVLDERGVGLDEPVNSLVPELAGLSEGITVRRLFDHTSGLEGDLWDDAGSNGDAVARFTARIPGLGTIAEPGAFFSYCNTGYVALGRLAEVLAGTSFDRVLERRVFGPLGTTHTTTRLVDAVQHRLALGHDLDASGVPRPRPWIAMRALGPTGGVLTTVPDLLRLAAAHLDHGGGLLSAAAAAAMATPSSTCVEPWTAGPAWGLGMTICTGPDGEPVVGHDGLWIGAGAYLRIVPGRNVAIAMVGAAGHARTVWHDVYPELLGRLGMAPPAMPAPQPGLAVDPARYVGTYRRLSQDVEVVERDGRLWMTSTPTGVIASVSAASTVELHPLAADAFRALASTGVEMPVVFTGGPGGDGDTDGPRRYLHSGMRAAVRRPAG